VIAPGKSHPNDRLTAPPPPAGTSTAPAPERGICTRARTRALRRQTRRPFQARLHHRKTGAGKTTSSEPHLQDITRGTALSCSLPKALVRFLWSITQNTPRRPHLLRPDDDHPHHFPQSRRLEDRRQLAAEAGAVAATLARSVEDLSAPCTISSSNPPLPPPTSRYQFSRPPHPLEPDSSCALPADPSHLDEHAGILAGRIRESSYTKRGGSPLSRLKAFLCRPSSYHCQSLFPFHEH